MKKLFLMMLIAGVAASLAYADEPNVMFMGDGDSEVRRIVIDREGVAKIDGDRVIVRNVKTRGFLGVNLVSLSNELKDHFGTNGRGVMISGIVDDSAAARAGLRAGDIIVAIDGSPVEDQGDLSSGLRDLQEGTVVQIAFIRDGVEQFASAIPELRKNNFHFNFEGPVVKFDDAAMGHLEAFELDTERMEKLEKELTAKLELNLERVGEGLDESMARVEVFLQSPEWKEKMIHLGDCAENQKAIEILSKRVKELERKLRDR